MSAGNKIYEKNIKPLFYFLYATYLNTSEQDKLILYDIVQDLKTKYVVDHVHGRGAGAEWERICDVMNLQLLTPEENMLKGSKREDKRRQNFKQFLRRILNR